MAERSRFLSYPYVVSTLALVVACSGGAYAAGLAKNSVTTKQLAPGAVQAADIKKDAVTGAAVKESTLDTVPNADKVGGLPASSFFPSSRVMFGRALQANGIQDLVMERPDDAWKIVGDGSSATDAMGIKVVATQEVWVYYLGSDEGAQLAYPGQDLVPTEPEFFIVDAQDFNSYTYVSCTAGGNIPSYTWCVGFKNG